MLNQRDLFEQLLAILKFQLSNPFQLLQWITKTLITIMFVETEFSNI